MKLSDTVPEEAREERAGRHEGPLRRIQTTVRRAYWSSCGPEVRAA